MREIEEYNAILASAGAAARDRQRGARRDRREVRRRAAHPAGALRGRHVGRGLHPRGGRRRHHHPRWLRQAHQSDLYRAQRRGGKGVRGAQLRQDDLVEHFFVTTTHHWLLFFTNKGRVYRAKAYQLPDAGRDARGQHVANLLAFQPDEQIAQIIDLKDYEVAPYLVLATKRGMVKKTRLDRVRLEPHRRPDRHQPARGRRGRERRARSRPAGHGRRRPAAGQPARHVGAVHRHRRGAAADGPGRPPASPACGSRATTSCSPWRSRARAVRLHRHRRRLRQAHPGRASTGCRAAAAPASRR